MCYRASSPVICSFANAENKLKPRKKTTTTNRLVLIGVNILILRSICVSCSRLQLQSPGHYSPLEAFYEDKRALLPPSGDGVITACPANAWGASINHNMHPEMKVGWTFPLLQLCKLASLGRLECCCCNLVRLVYEYLWNRSPTLQAVCPSSSASSGSRSWCCGNWPSSADASSSSPLHPWAWSATEVRNICIYSQGCLKGYFNIWGIIHARFLA